MRKRNVLKNEEAVSPVIATILMVAITVVLAATLYMMLPGAEETGTPVAGSLDYLHDDSTTNRALFQMTLSTPSEPNIDHVSIRVFDENATRVDTTELDTGHEDIDSITDIIIHRTSDEGVYVASGDRVELNHNHWTGVDTGDGFSGWEVVITFDGYSGAIDAVVP